jgi:hypothetical protein
MGESIVNDFVRDNTWQLSIRNTFLEPFYSKKAKSGRFIFVDKGKLAEILQKEMAIDTILQGEENRAIPIEEKIVRWPGYKYTAYTLEIMSCTNPGFEKKGWMHYAKCDILLYCFEQADGSIVAHALPFHTLQEWFLTNYQKYCSTVTKQINHTECKIVPITDVWANVKGCKEFIMPVGEDVHRV